MFKELFTEASLNITYINGVKKPYRKLLLLIGEYLQNSSVEDYKVDKIEVKWAGKYRAHIGTVTILIPNTFNKFTISGIDDSGVLADIADIVKNNAKTVKVVTDGETKYLG